MKTTGRKTDTTEARETVSNTAIRGSATRLAAILDSIADGITAQDAAGCMVYANRTAARASGYESVEAMLAAPPGDFLSRFDLLDEHGRPFPPDRLPGRRAILTGEDAEETLRYRVRSTGVERWVNIRAVPVADERGDARTSISVFRDITARRRAEDAQSFLAEASRELAESLDYGTTLANVARLAVPVLADWCAVDVVRDDGTLDRLAVAHQDPAKVEWAHELQRRYPSDPDAPHGVHNVLRTRKSEFYPEVPDDLLTAIARDAEHLELLRRVGFRSAMVVPLVAHEHTLGAMTFVSAESGRHYESSDLALAEDLARRAATAIENALLFREVQEAREELESQAEQLEETAVELEAANDELVARTAEAEAARTEAETANQAKSDFLAMMSHELRTPLNAIGGYTELLELGIHGPVTNAQTEDLRRIQRNQRHLVGVITDVLNFARLETGRIELSMQEFALDPVLAEMQDLIGPQVADSGLAYEYRPGDPPVRVHADPERLRQVILNLLSNAVKFTGRGGRITVDWETAGDEVRIRVRDTGRGIPPDQLQAIFEPFVQVDQGLTREASGSGLGLSISRDLVRAMGGDLTADSMPGRGSVFTCSIRRAPVADESTASGFDGRGR